MWPQKHKSLNLPKNLKGVGLEGLHYTALLGLKPADISLREWWEQNLNGRGIGHN